VVLHHCNYSLVAMMEGHVENYNNTSWEEEYVMKCDWLFYLSSYDCTNQMVLL